MNQPGDHAISLEELMVQNNPAEEPIDDEDDHFTLTLSNSFSSIDSDLTKDNSAGHFKKPSREAREHGLDIITEDDAAAIEVYKKARSSKRKSKATKEEKRRQSSSQSPESVTSRTSDSNSWASGKADVLSEFSHLDYIPRAIRRSVSDEIPSTYDVRQPRRRVSPEPKIHAPRRSKSVVEASEFQRSERSEKKEKKKKKKSKDSKKSPNRDSSRSLDSVEKTKDRPLHSSDQHHIFDIRLPIAPDFDGAGVRPGLMRSAQSFRNHSPPPPRRHVDRAGSVPNLVSPIPSSRRSSVEMSPAGDSATSHLAETILEHLSQTLEDYTSNHSAFKSDKLITLMYATLDDAAAKHNNLFRSSNTTATYNSSHPSSEYRGSQNLSEPRSNRFANDFGATLESSAGAHNRNHRRTLPQLTVSNTKKHLRRSWSLDDRDRGARRSTTSMPDMQG